MKKSVLYTGLSYMLLGTGLFTIAMVTEFPYEGILWGFIGALIGPGILMIYKYYYWSRPKNQNKYDEMLETEKIEKSDERKVMLRDKSGYMVNMFMMMIYTILIVVFSILAILGYGLPFLRYVVIGLAALLLFQWICWVVIFNNLSKKF